MTSTAAASSSSSSSSSSSDSTIATAKMVLSAVASAAAAAMVFRSVAQEYLPHEIKHYISASLRKFSTLFSTQVTIIIEEFNGLVPNEVYRSAEAYLGTKIAPSTRRFKVNKQEREQNIELTVDRDEETIDVFNGVKFRWVLVVQQIQRTTDFYNPRDINSTLRSEVRSFELSFHRKYKSLVLDYYLPHVMDRAKTLEQQKRTLNIFTVDHEHRYGSLSDLWQSVPLKHPATFDTLAMDDGFKQTIKKDLARFLERKEYYKRVGKAWKRGYLLFGPPGTGKSSLIAAMANYLNFDVYDLELTELSRNSDLRRLLLATANRSILVVEDIDCTIDFKDREGPAVEEPSPDYNPRRKKVTLSGFLNFIDGLWSSCGDERIVVLTTNHKEKLDPALLRPGRMDMHIHMSYCTPDAFRVLASNYLGIKDHGRLREINEALLGTEVTPAEVAEQLMKDDDPDRALGGLVEFLKAKKVENEEEAQEWKKQGESE